MFIGQGYLMPGIPTIKVQWLWDMRRAAVHRSCSVETKQIIDIAPLADMEGCRMPHPSVTVLPRSWVLRRLVFRSIEPTENFQHCEYHDYSNNVRLSQISIMNHSQSKASRPNWNPKKNLPDRLSPVIQRIDLLERAVPTISITTKWMFVWQNQTFVIDTIITVFYICKRVVGN